MTPNVVNRSPDPPDQLPAGGRREGPNKNETPFSLTFSARDIDGVEERFKDPGEGGGGGGGGGRAHAQHVVVPFTQ